MLPVVPVPPRRLDEYREVAGEDAVEDLREAAEGLQGLRLLHVTSSPSGTGVAELLHPQVALLNDLGLNARWRVIHGSDAFFNITKFMHNGLHGFEVPWDREMRNIYESRMRDNAVELLEGFDADLVIVHDPQPLGILSAVDGLGERPGRWAWRCHLDLSTPFEPVWDYLCGHAERYDAAVFTMKDFVPASLSAPRLFVIPPSIDPLSAKNQWIDPDTVYEILHRYGVQWTRPVVTQVARLDPWSDPIGAIDAYRLARSDVPDLQLVLISTMTHEDPEAWHYLELTERHRDDDPGVFLLTNLQGVGALEVNAFQRDSQVVLQKSIREGFGLGVSEALWKGTPVIGGDTGGIRMQIEDGVSGFLVDSVEACGRRLVELLTDVELGEAMARAGRRRVRGSFLTVRELRDMLLMVADLVEERPAADA
jgi:trehalose synthase